jgi:hypothetical protein
MSRFDGGSSLMGRYVAGRSIYENCGAFVIVREDTLERLEESAPIIRDLLGRASRAGTVEEMGALLDALPLGYGPDWREIAEEEFEVNDLSQPPREGMYERCVERFFWSSASEMYDSTLLFDTTACYADMIDGDREVRDLIWPFVGTALHDLDAGFDELDGPIGALEGAGHTCAQDDDRIRWVFGHLMTDTYLRAEEGNVRR